MKPISIENVRGATIAANAASPVLSPGTYDVYAAALAYIRVSKAGTVPTSSNGYPIPAGAIITLTITRDDQKIATTAALLFHKVG